MENCTNQIVLLGGGYASIWAYRALVNELMIEMIMGLVRIKVICPEEFHFFHGWTAESLTGIIQDHNRMSPLKEVFEHAEIIKGKAVRVDHVTRLVYVELNNGTNCEVPYNQLLLGMGSADSNSVDGLAEHAYQLKSHSGYLRTKMRIQFLVRQASEADPFTALQLLRFVVAGCGYTGIEIAANLAEMIIVQKKQYPALRHFIPSIHLINSKDELLPGLDNGFKSMQHYAEKTLGKYGIKIRNQTRINRVTSQGVYLSDGSFIECQMVISTIGQSRIVLEGTDKMERDQEKRVITNSFLQVKNHNGIWGAGDAVHVTHSKTMIACPANALWAIKQGEHAGKNMVRAILSHSLKPFIYKGLGQCASLGIGKGLGEIYGFQFTGWFAWIMRWFFFQHFMPSKKVMWRKIKDWFHLLLSGKRIDLSMTEKPTLKIFTRERVQPAELNQLRYQN